MEDSDSDSDVQLNKGRRKRKANAIEENNDNNDDDDDVDDEGISKMPYRHPMMDNSDSDSDVPLLHRGRKRKANAIEENDDNNDDDVDDNEGISKMPYRHPMMDNSDSDSDVPLHRGRKTKANAIEEDDDSDDVDDKGISNHTMDNSDSDSDVPLLHCGRKRKANAIEEDDDSDEDYDEGSDSEDNESESDDDDVIDIVQDDTQDDQCSICLMEFTNQLLGIPDSCAHIFCSVCLLEWSKNVNTCPVDRKVFYTIAVRKTKGGQLVDQVKVEDRTRVKEEYEDPTACEVCGLGDREETMLLCDDCDRGFHMECLRPPLTSVPEDEWFCLECRVNHNTSSTWDISSSDPFAQEPETSGAAAMRGARPSASSRGGRARTVATTRRRRRRRTTSRQSSTTRARRSSTRRRGSSKKRGRSSSTRGSSTSTKRKTRTTKKGRRKRKRRKKTRSTSKEEEVSGTTSRHNTSSSRYLFPHEMESSASFSLFGSDFDLEYLPVIEDSRNETITKPKPEKLPSNPDVLGSIFTGSNTLYHKDVSLNSTGSLSLPDSSPSPVKSQLEDDRECSSSKNKQSNIKKVAATKTNSSNLDDLGSSSHNGQRVMSELNRKRIKYFENKAKRTEAKSEAKGEEVKTFNTLFGKGKLLTKASKDQASTAKDQAVLGGTKLKQEAKNRDVTTRSRETESKPKTHTEQCTSKEEALGGATKKQNSKSKRATRRRETSERKPKLSNSYSLSSYKIPRKKSSSVDSNNASGETLDTNKPTVTMSSPDLVFPRNTRYAGITSSSNNIVSPTSNLPKTTSSMVIGENGLCEGTQSSTANNRGILHLLPSEVSRKTEPPKGIRRNTSNYATTSCLAEENCIFGAATSSREQNKCNDPVNFDKEGKQKSVSGGESSTTRRTTSTMSSRTTDVNQATWLNNDMESISVATEYLSNRTATSANYLTNNPTTTAHGGCVRETFSTSTTLGTDNFGTDTTPLSSAKPFVLPNNNAPGLHKSSTMLQGSNSPEKSNINKKSSFSKSNLESSTKIGSRVSSSLKTSDCLQQEAISPRKSNINKNKSSSSKIVSTVSSCSNNISKLQTVTNLQLIGILKKKKNYLSSLSDEESFDTKQTTASSSQASTSGLVVSNKKTDATKRKLKVLPPLQPLNLNKTRTSAKQKTVTFSENLSVDDVAKKRKEGIERLRRNQQIQDEVRGALTSFYRHKEITKEEYKCIYTRAVKKIQESSAAVESRGVMNLVRNYVKKIKGVQLTGQITTTSIS